MQNHWESKACTPAHLRTEYRMAGSQIAPPPNTFEEPAPPAAVRPEEFSVALRPSAPSNDMLIIILLVVIGILLLRSSTPRYERILVLVPK